MENLKITHQHFKIRLDEVDSTHRITVLSIIGYLQEIAWEASLRAGYPIPVLFEKGLTWVLSRLRLEMLAYPTYRETIQIETWASRAEKFVMQRDFKLMDMQGNVWGKSTANWVVIDFHRKKLLPLPDYIIEAYLVENGAPFPPLQQKLPDLLYSHATFETQIRWNDLDQNQHTNNKNYFRWLIDSIPSEWLENHTIDMLDVQFKLETNLGDKIKVQISDNQENSFIHKISFLNDEREILRGISKWKS